MEPRDPPHRARSRPRRDLPFGYALALDARPGAPTLVAQIADAIANDVRRGVLRPGDRLPGSRTLAARLEVHRNTALAALRELERQGFLRTEKARGTFVSEALPETLVRTRAGERAGAGVETRTPEDARFDVPRARLPLPELPPEGALPLLGGVPDLRLVPTVALARAIRRALRSPRALAYGDPRGERPLRQAIASMLARTRGLAVGPDDVLITRGSQMALDLVARTLLEPGDVVAVEALGYRPAWLALEAGGAKLAPIPVDRDGASVDAIRALADRGGLRAVYLTPHHQYPTTVVLSAPRRLALLALARERRFAILEDDYDHEFHYEGRPILPLAASAPSSVVYVGTLSKVLAPGLRLGWVVAPPPLGEQLVARRTYVDRQGDSVLERALAELFEDGEIGRHVLRMRRVYRERRDCFVDLLRETFGARLRFDVPQGGMSLWARAPGLDVDAWVARAAERGVWLQAARRFTFDRRSRPYVRLGYGALDQADLARAVTVLLAALPPAR